MISVIHGFTLSALESPMKTEKTPCLNSSAWIAVLDLKILCDVICSI